jgi:hypothetical protein
MSPNLAVSIALLVSFAAFITAHAVLAFGLIIEQRGRWRCWLVLLPPAAWLAPYWGYRAGMHRRAVTWGVMLLAYLISLALAYTR